MLIARENRGIKHLCTLELIAAPPLRSPCYNLLWYLVSSHDSPSISHSGPCGVVHKGEKSVFYYTSFLRPTAAMSDRLLTVKYRLRDNGLDHSWTLFLYFPQSKCIANGLSEILLSNFSLNRKCVEHLKHSWSAVGLSPLLLTDPSDLNQIRSMRSFALITSNTKSSRLSRSSYTKATQSSRCCGVASIVLHFVQILNFLSPRENLRVSKSTDNKRPKAVWSFLTALKRIAHLGLHNDTMNELVDASKKCQQEPFFLIITHDKSRVLHGPEEW
ncbi:hypothetical protein AVEN_158180-1 [Araneus ventricosus]|uniref:Uncharacterized protein n=1 Tax=Araneus ventricosus TaxID=182803 RepID=A0A4Y2G445_ARAVE|nr:hypothetical protein AVEN_158180-1 [Araneus ventricosus]